MAKFLVFHQESLVGHSALEHGDPPMGVAFGEFVPTTGYESIAAHCKSNHADQSELALSVQTDDGFTIPCIGVAVLDYSEKAGEPYAQLNILGIEHDTYKALFPGHVAAYDRKFGGADGSA